ncbi:hypothetical protein ACFWGD_11595 [Corynebacterium sp. NPDC060344]|uniref:hypothetical protein n=1 Tax=Corynebacterium sp. NPDC060344 TaxID=3347101 RepID=UPI00364AA7F0
MRKFPTFAALAASAMLLAGCSGGSVDTGSETIADTSATPQPSASELAERPETPQAPSSGPTVAEVPEDRFMPPGAQGARIFRLADGATECFANALGPDSFLTCRTNFANPPMVQSYDGGDVPANAVTWSPGAAPTFAHMNFPDNGFAPETLHPYERVSFFGFTCTAYGDATVECSGPGGRASLDAGNVTGAEVPEAKPAPAPAPEQAPAPAAPELPGIELPGVPDIFGPQPGQ